jgi:Sugar phosphate permease
MVWASWGNKYELNFIGLSSLNSIYQFYLLYFLFGALGSALLFSPLYANVGFWFRENPGLALGIAASGGAVGQAFIPHLSGILILSYGWQSAYIYLALIYISISFPISLLIKESPWRIDARSDAINDERNFPLSEKAVVAWISFAVIFCCVCMSVPIMHLVPLLTDKGFSLEFSTFVLMLLMICGAFGRIFGGLFGVCFGALPGCFFLSLGPKKVVVWFPHFVSTPH